jgi:hypothetical protein
VSEPPVPPPPPPGPPPSYSPVPAGGQANQNYFGLIGLILGIASIPLACCFGSGLVFGAAGAVLGYLGKQKAAQGLANNGGQANAGFITGIVGAALSLLWVISFNFLDWGLGWGWS